MRSFPFEGVVLVADLLTATDDRLENAKRRDLEQTEEYALNEILAAIRALGLQSYHYQSPAELASQAHRHSRDIVLTTFGGTVSRSRMALVPAVCEALGLSYVGPDAYGRIVAQDKEIAKRLATDFGIATPPWRVIRSRDEVNVIEGLIPPLVLKPLLEGSSIGISRSSLQGTARGAVQVASDLLEEFGQPVIAEQFVSGREISYNKIESSQANLWGLSEVIITSDPAYFEGRLFDADEKLIRHPDRTVRNIDLELQDGDKNSLDRFLAAFGRYGYCRVDGRLQDGQFVFIELTPDAWLGRQGQFAMAFTQKGFTYEEVIAEVLLSAKTAPPSPWSNG